MLPEEVTFADVTLSELDTSLDEIIQKMERIKELLEEMPTEDEAEDLSDYVANLRTCRELSEWFPSDDERLNLKRYVANLKKRRELDG